jgi:carbonic anhydrase/acetyltransferase-like protein (isoleucine patch superfamily)
VIGAFSHVPEGVKLGAGCAIGDQVSIEAGACLGNEVTVCNGVQIMRDVSIEDDVYVGSNSTVLPGIVIGRSARVEPGALVTRSVPPNAIVTGNPARIVGYANTGKQEAVHAQLVDEAAPVVATTVKGVNIHNMPLVDDLRGALSAAEFGEHIPFDVKRYFLVFDVSSEETRGEHAHKACHQFLVCVSGSVSVVADDGEHREEFLLDKPNLALHIPPGVWGIQYNYSRDSVLMVLASEHYDPEDYIRDYGDFLNYIK